MKKISVLVCILLLSFVHAFSQPSQAEIDKKIKDAQLEIEKMKKDPKYKELLKDMPNLDSMMKNVKGNKPAGTKNKTSKPDNRILPAKNSKLLSQLPKTILTTNELSNYLKTSNRC